MCPGCAGNDYDTTTGWCTTCYIDVWAPDVPAPDHAALFEVVPAPRRGKRSARRQGGLLIPAMMHDAAPHVSSSAPQGWTAPHVSSSAPQGWTTPEPSCPASSLPHPMTSRDSRCKPARPRVFPDALRPLNEQEVWMMCHPVWEPCTMGDAAVRPASIQCDCRSIDCRKCRIWRMTQPPEARRFYEQSGLAGSTPPCSWCGYPTHMICDWCPMLLSKGLPVTQVCSQCDQLVGMCRVCFSVRRYETQGRDQTCANCGKKKSGEHLSKCGKCLLVRYCSTECQHGDWPQHCKLCRVLCDSQQVPPLLFRWRMPGQGLITWRK